MHSLSFHSKTDGEGRSDWHVLSENFIPCYCRYFCCCWCVTSPYRLILFVTAVQRPHQLSRGGNVSERQPLRRITVVLVRANTTTAFPTSSHNRYIHTYIYSGRSHRKGKQTPLPPPRCLGLRSSSGRRHRRRRRRRRCCCSAATAGSSLHRLTESRRRRRRGHFHYRTTNRTVTATTLAAAAAAATTTKPPEVQAGRHAGGRTDGRPRDGYYLSFGGVSRSFVPFIHHYDCRRRRCRHPTVSSRPSVGRSLGRFASAANRN